MRLIDADEFKKQMAGMALISPSYFTSKVVKLLEIIDEQPTVEAVPVVHAEWIRKDDTICYWYECSNCGSRILKNRFGQNAYSSFCPNCGADMRKKV